MVNEFYIFVSVFIGLVIRAVYLLFKNFRNTNRTIPKKRFPRNKVKTVIVMGSGGHTTEMLYLVKNLNLNRYSPRLYVIASSDKWSEQKVHEFEFESKFKDGRSKYKVMKIPRSRSVHQSYFTSMFTTALSTIVVIPNLLYFNPDLVLCNGPGTCVPVCIIAFLLKCCFISNNTIIFLESICRVKTLSLTGRALQWFVDEMLVQWPELLLKSRRAKYIGRIA